MRQHLLFALLTVFSLLSSGCLQDGDSRGDLSETAPESRGPYEEVEGLWNGTTRQTLFRITDSRDTEADVLCLLGGGPRLDRTDGRVLPGTGFIEILVELDPTYTGIQFGYVVDGNGGAHETDAENVTWLEPPARPGETRTWRIEVAPDQFEAPGGLVRWDFYRRMTIADAAEDLCYTGGGAGTLDIHVEAVRGP